MYLCGLCFVSAATAADDGGELDYEFAISIERSELSDLSLGDDPDLERLEEEEIEFEFGFEYRPNDQLYFFLVGAYKDEVEAEKPGGERDSLAGIERKEIGVGYLFGEEVESDLNVGRMEFESASEWWIWWDEELDGIRLESAFGNFETMLGIAEEQARESTGLDRIDPEAEDVRRLMASLAWEFADNHSLLFYYLDQDDRSKSYYDGFGTFDDCNDGPPSPTCESEDKDKIDEEDADLAWKGISYLGGFDVEDVGEFEVELHYAEVSGDEIIYDFDDLDPVTGLSEVTGRSENSVDGSARGFLLSWTPAAFDDWSFTLSRAIGEGDGNLNDNRDRSYRQNGLQGDIDAFGELYQPELSNLEVRAVGVEWEVREGIGISLVRYDYEQDELDDEMRDVSLEVDPTGLDRDLGHEMDLILTVEAYDGLEFVLIAAEFEAGDAYGDYEGETSRFVKFELSYEF